MCLALLGLAGLGSAGAGSAGAASALSTMATIAGTALSAAGAIQQGRAAGAAADYNALAAQQSAIAENQRAAYEAGMTRDRVRGIMAQQRAGFASAGLDPRAGTPLAVLGDTARQGELDVLNRLYAGESAATAHRNDAARLHAEGRMARRAAGIGAATSLIGGLSKLATSRYSPLNG